MSYYPTTDIHLATFLYSRGVPLSNVVPQGKGKVVFMFMECRVEVQEYYVDNPMINAKDYAKNFKHLRTLLRHANKLKTSALLERGETR